MGLGTQVRPKWLVIARYQDVLAGLEAHRRVASGGTKGGAGCGVGGW